MCVCVYVHDSIFMCSYRQYIQKITKYIRAIVVMCFGHRDMKRLNVYKSKCELIVVVPSKILIAAISRNMQKSI